MHDREKVISEIEDALSNNLAKAGYIYELSLVGLKNKALTDALALLKEQDAVVLCKDCNECYFASNRAPHEQSWACGKHGIDVTPNWFCADGERRTDDA